MVFSSPLFLFLFLPLVLGLYQLCPRPLKNLFLLFASLVFYAWGEPTFVILMLVSIVINYLIGLWLSRATTDRVNIVAMAVIANIGLLAYFKYANFLVEDVNSLLGQLGRPQFRTPNIALPIGISFFTFQALSYVIDVYRRDKPAEKNPINVALYIALFPQLIAGPIVRYGSVAAQLVERTVCLDGFAYGVARFIVGLGKKVLIANSVAVAADEIFDGVLAQSPSELSTGLAWLGIVCYTLQIYFDFSGYSDMAIGLGHMFGFQFPENFDYPYASASIREFWRRWHMSLSSWFRDYLYVPLGGNRVSAARVYVNLLIVFALCGLWHGANWTFLVWGLYHGAFLVLERAGFGTQLGRTPAPLRHAYALLVVMMGWVLFRAATLTDAAFYLRSLCGLSGGGLGLDQVTSRIDVVLSLAIAAGILGSVPVLPKLAKLAEEAVMPRPRLAELLTAVSSFGGVAVLLLIFWASVISLSAGTYNPFIYFRF